MAHTPVPAPKLPDAAAPDPGWQAVDIAQACPSITHSFALLDREAWLQQGGQGGQHAQHLPCLMVRIAGHYGVGSAGNGDAELMRGLVNLASGLWWHESLILDLRELHYEWGDEIDKAFGDPAGQPFALLVGPHCEAALATLLDGENPHSTRRATDFHFVFDQLSEALQHLSGVCQAKAKQAWNEPAPPLPVLQAMLPQHKHDVMRAKQLLALGRPAIQAVLPELLAWLQDANWPIHRVLQPGLANLDEDLAPAIAPVLRGPDDIWKHNALQLALCTGPALALALQTDLRRLATQPTAGEMAEGVPALAQELLQRWVLT